MNTWLWALGAAVLIILIVLIWSIATYNTLIALKERVQNAKGQIAAQLESRWDAVKSLIDATKKYALYEAELLENITRQRVSVSQSSNVRELEEANDQYNQVVGRLLAVSENYPELKANEVYKEATSGIGTFENYVRHARMIYNDCVTKFNQKIKMFPSSIIAGAFGFTEEGYFETTDAKQDIPGWE